MMFLFWFGALLCTWVASLLRLSAGNSGWLIPSVALCAVLLCARRSQQAGRYQTAAVLCGLCAGLPLQGSFLAPAIVLLLLGSLAHATRRFLSADGPVGMLLVGSFYAFLQALLLLLFPGAGSALKLSEGELFGAVGGLVMTGVLFAACDIVVSRWRSLRHALERR
jgi:hypothetical protein